MLHFLLFILMFKTGLCLWSKGIVHYSINDQYYDIHSQDLIKAALSGLQKELCIKFFDTPSGYKASVENKLLIIQNPNRIKDCTLQTFNFTTDVVEMPIGYNCLSLKDIRRIIVEMLYASIGNTEARINSYDLRRIFEERTEASSTHLSPEVRNFINSHYHMECSSPRQVAGRRFESEETSVAEDIDNYYKDKLWPLGVVLYGVESQLQNSPHHLQLIQAMGSIELASCVVFQEASEDVLRARSLLWFADQGAEAPQLGFLEGNQTVSLKSMIEYAGGLGYSAHTLNLLMRALGVPMASNRHDRDYYVNIHWNNVESGKEHYLERVPVNAALVPYDFDSVTHAPANFMCRDCSQGQTTVQPAQDYLWQRTMMMGHRKDLSEGDKNILRLLYSKPCTQRYAAGSK